MIRRFDPAEVDELVDVWLASTSPASHSSRRPIDGPWKGICEMSCSLSLRPG